MLRKLLLAACSAAVAVPLLGSTPASAAPSDPAGSARISQVVTFGDSWSSANYVFGTAPGGSWSQVLAERIGRRQKADTDGGLNYARGGAFVAPIAPYSTDQSPTPMTEQVATYLREHKRFTPRQLVTLWAAGNDAFAYLGGFDEGERTAFCAGTQSPAQVNHAAAMMRVVARREVRLLQKVLRRGAEHAVVVDMVDLGLTANDGCMNADANAIAGVMSKVHNLALVDELRAAGLLGDRRVELVRISKLFDAVAADPAAHGFAVVDGDACVKQAPDCSPANWVAPDADRSHVFAQSGHFTRHTRELIATTVLRKIRRHWPSAF